MNEIMTREYKVINATMDRDFNLSAAGAQMLAQECFASLMASHGVAAFDLRRKGQMWIISEYSMEFDGGMPFWGDSVTVELWLSEISPVKVYSDYRILHDGRVFCKGYCVWAILDIGSRRPVCASEVLSDVGVTPERLFESYRIRVPEKGAQKYESVYRTNVGDIDFNNHICNISYLEAGLDVLPDEYCSSHALKSVSMRFRHESFLGDKLVCHAYETTTDGQWFCEVVNDSGVVCSDICFVYAND